MSLKNGPILHGYSKGKDNTCQCMHPLSLCSTSWIVGNVVTDHKSQATMHYLSYTPSRGRGSLARSCGITLTTMCQIPVSQRGIIMPAIFTLIIPLWIQYYERIYCQKNFICYTATVQQATFWTDLDLCQAGLDPVVREPP